MKLPCQGNKQGKLENDGIKFVLSYTTKWKWKNLRVYYNENLV